VNINAVGYVSFWFDAPITLVSSPTGSDSGTYVPAVIEPGKASNGSIWGAEGPSMMNCFSTDFGVGILYRLTTKRFLGSTFLLRTPDQSYCDTEGPCDVNHPAAGSASIVSNVTVGGSSFTVVCQVTDWYENGYYTNTTIDSCWYE
jgi:hypothetical protein